MKISGIHIVIISLYTSLLLLSGSGHASECDDDDEMMCDISNDLNQSSNRSEICVTMSNEQQLQNIQQRSVKKRNTLNFTCVWKHCFTTSTFKVNFTSPEGWKIFFRVDSSRNIKVTAEDWHVEDQHVTRSTSSKEYSRSFDSLEDRHFDNAAHGFLSRTNKITIEVMKNPHRSPTSDETFNVIVRTVQVTDSVDSQSQDCSISHQQEWGENGYNGLDSNFEMPNGSLSIECRKGLPQREHLISFCYDLAVKSIHGLFNFNGFIQHVYVNSRDVITDKDLNLYIISNFSKNNSSRIRFEARGHMDLNIYNVTVQGLIYNDHIDDTDPPAPPPSFVTLSSSTTQLLTTLISDNSSSSTRLLSSTSGNTNSSIPSPSATEGQTSSDKTSLNTEGPNLEIMTKGDGDSQGFLVPTVSVLAIVALVSIAVISVCCRKRYHKNQSRGSDPTSSDEDSRSTNQERHDYCEVHPSGKPPAELTGDGTVVSSSTPVDNNRGSMDVPTYEEAVDYEETTAKIKKPTANSSTVSMNGQEYAVVDMNKKALERTEKAKNALNSEHCLESNNVEAYATLEPDRTSESRGGQTKQSDSPIKRVLRNGSEYAMVDMDKKTRGRISARAQVGISNGNDQESNVDKGDKTVEHGKASADDDGKTKVNNPTPDYDDYDELQSPPIKDTPGHHSVKKGLHDSTSEDYDELQARANGLNSKVDERTTGYDDYDELQSPTDPSPPSKVSVHETRGQIFDESIHDYQAVSEPTSPTESIQPDPYLQNDYDTVSPPVSPGAVSVGHGTNQPNDDETTSSHNADSLHQKQFPLNIHDRVKNEGSTENRDSTMSHTYEDPVAMALALERPYDKLQRASIDRKQPSISDREVGIGADHEEDLNLYNEIATSAVAKESTNNNDAYHHLQRPHTKRSVKADTPLPEIPGGEGYGRLDLDTTRQTHTPQPLEQDQRGPATNEADPAYATLENPTEAKLPDDEDPDYDLLDAFV